MPQEHPDLNDIVGTYDMDTEVECQRCHCLFFVCAGDLKRKHCDVCSNTIMAESNE